MSDRFKAFWLGIFILACIAILTWFLLFLRPTVGDGKQVLRIRFANIEKVNVGTRVTFAGKPVGEVVKINEIYDARNEPTDERGNFYFYELVVRVDSHVHIYKNDEIIFSTQGLMGEKTIAIIPKKGPNDEITTTVLYARSSSKMDDAVDQLILVSDRMNHFFEKNTDDFHCALTSFRETSTIFSQFIQKIDDRDLTGKLAFTLDKFDTLLQRVSDNNLIDHTTNAMLNLGDIAASISAGEGTFGKLVASDCVYTRLCGTLGRFETLLDTLNNYGLFYQFSGKWQRQRNIKVGRMKELCCTSDYYKYFNRELLSISNSLNRVNCAINKMECSQVRMDNPCVQAKFQDLLEQVNELEMQLKLYNEFFMQEYGKIYGIDPLLPP